jgi:hypothetical protein
MATRKIKTNKNKKVFRRTRSKKHRGGGGEKKKPKIIKSLYEADGLENIRTNRDDILLEGNVGDRVEYIPNSQLEDPTVFEIIKVNGINKLKHLSGSTETGLENDNETPVDHEIKYGENFSTREATILAIGKVGEKVLAPSPQQLDTKYYIITEKENGGKYLREVDFEDYYDGGSKRKSKKGTKRKSNKRK